MVRKSDLMTWWQYIAVVLFNLNRYACGPGTIQSEGVQWLSGRVLDSRPRGYGFEPHRRHCVVVLEQGTFYPSLVLVQPRKTRPCLTERLLMGRKESKQTKQKQNHSIRHTSRSIENQRGSLLD